LPSFARRCDFGANENNSKGRNNLLRPIVRVLSACAFALASAAAQSQPVDVVEYYNAALDHYFITWVPAEIAQLDAGTTLKGWTRTGKSFRTHTSPQAETSPVCRFYIPPQLGNSHFFGRGATECESTLAKNPSFTLEDSAFMHMFLPSGGTCPVDTDQVYRVFSNRPDANHRYMIDKSTRATMVAKGWLAEGDGPDLVVMCAPAAPTTGINYYPEIASPLLLGFVPGGGKPTTFFGDRAADGSASAIRGLLVDEGAGAQTVIDLDSVGKPTAVAMAGGGRMKFSWQPNGSAIVEVTTADGKNGGSVTLAGLAPKSLTPKLAGPLLPKAGTANLQVSVTESGVLAGDANVLATVEGLSSKKAYKVPLQPLGPGKGVYGGQFVNAGPIVADPAAACNSVVTTASQACGVLDAVSTGMISVGCPLLAAEVALFTGPGGLAVLAGCEATFGAAAAACRVVEVGSGVQPATCAAVESFVRLYDGDGVRITVNATKGATSGSSQQSFPSSATAPSMTVALGCPPPKVPYNGTCGTSFPLTRDWVGRYDFTLSVGSCKLSFSDDAVAMLTQLGESIVGDLFFMGRVMDLDACKTVGNNAPFIGAITGKMDGSSNITLSLPSGNTVYSGTGTLRNGVLKFELVNNVDFGGLNTFKFTLQ